MQTFICILPDGSIEERFDHTKFNVLCDLMLDYDIAKVEILTKKEYADKLRPVRIGFMNESDRYQISTFHTTMDISELAELRTHLNAQASTILAARAA